MNKIHSGILAIVLSIFLIQATDPPFENPSGHFLQYFPVKIVTHDEVTLPSPTEQYLRDRSITDRETNKDDLKHFHSYLSQLQDDSQNSTNSGQGTVNLPEEHGAISKLLHKQKSPYEKLLEKDFIKPLLKLYESQIHQKPDYVIGNATAQSRISKEDYVDDLKVLSKEELDMLIHGSEKYQQNEYDDEDKNQDLTQDQSFQENVQLSRRDDTLVENNDKEHIGEILPSDFNDNQSNERTLHTQHRFSPVRRRIYHQNWYNPRHTNYRMRKSYEYDEGFKPSHPYTAENTEAPRLRSPISFPGERFRPEYEPTAISNEGIDNAGYPSDQINKYNRPESYDSSSSPKDEARTAYSRPSRLNFPPSEVNGFRIPRRFRGFRDPYSEGFQPTAREPYFDPSSRFHSSWPSRRPRVIFPTDLVAFRDPVQNGNQDQEPEWLAGDNSLQDIQEQDTRDKGAYEFCSPGATCEFFLSCWLSGGLLDQPCDGLLRGCCFRGAAKKGRNDGLSIGTLEAPRETGKSSESLLRHKLGCGVSSPRQQAQRRIVGGEEAGFGTFPWQAYIRIGSSRCGGSLVSRRHVVTAGHCVARATPRQVHVTLGDYVINSAVEPLPAYTFGVSNIQVHPFFKFTPQADRFDVAVLRLDRTAHNLPHITPICLPPRGENFLGEVGVAAGWGALSPGSRLRPQTLQAVQVPVIDNRQCERWHRSKGITVTIYDEMMCAGYKNGGRDSCQGDSGGPLMLQKTGRWFLVGIVSAGYSCAQPGQPGIYHRVAHTVDWITRAIGS
ncbi:uncharacterized protein LOC108913614 [Anoplophora glabripennis]|uniref:uncharacterized protein LOC108913614 n=1 Tax=Anoplophora glabripennis TaxID=217634 RepID=UPI000C792FE7|nr:uncharacterized protein LOC108913614 [Anoplophora glabripennis]